MSKVAIVFWSQTGNTETMANCIAEGAGANATIIPCSEMNAAKLGEYDVVAFGCPAMGAEQLEESEFEPMFAGLEGSLNGKKIALFGTCGMGNDPAYYQKVIDRVKTWIPEDNEYMDAFLCQGKMPIQVRRRYEEMAKSGQNTEQIQAMIRNFDRAMLHPDRADEAAAADFAVQVWKRIGS